MPRSTVSIVLYLFLVFLSGVLVGGFGYRLIDPPEVKGDPRVRYEDEVRLRLKMNPEQARKFHDILDNTGEQFKAVRERCKPQFEAVYQDQLRAVNEILTGEQRKEYEKYRNEKDAERRRRKAAKK